MAALPDAPETPRIGVLALGLAAAAACGLAGCGVHYASSEPALMGDYRERHPIVVASAPTSLDIYPIGSALDERSTANIRAFAQRYRHFGAGPIMVLTPNSFGRGTYSRAVAEIRSALANAGLNGKVVSESYTPPAGSPAAPVRLSFVGVKAVVPTPCGDWPEDLASGSSLEGWKNEPYANFGCATQSMMAAQVDDPRDFVQSRALDPSDVAMRTRAIEDVRKGQDPGTVWTTALTPIGGTTSTTGN